MCVYLFRLCIYICLYMYLKFTKVDHYLLKIFFSFGFQATDFLLPYCLVITPNGSVVKNPPTMQEMQVLSLGQEDSPKEGNGNPLQYSCLGNPTERGHWQAIVHEAAKESDMTY